MRDTGRTTRMLKDAVRLANEGCTVYVVAQSHLETAHMMGILNNIPNSYKVQNDNSRKIYKVKLETPETLGNFDLERCELIGAHSNCKVLVDHHVIESRYPFMINMLRRYEGNKE